MAEFMPVFESVQKTRVYRAVVNPLEEFDDNDFVDRYRLSRSTFLELCDLLDGKLERKDTRGHPLSVSCQIAAALRYYATGSFQLVLADTLNLSQSSISRSITNVSEALDEYFDDYVAFSTEPAQLQHEKTRFASIAGFPNVIACIDGTHIPVQRPHENEYEYVNRKGFHSINVQAMCDHKGRFTNLVVRFPGSTHDAHILRTSEFFAYMEANTDIGIVLGDSGYPLRPWLHTPFRRPSTASEKRYNESHRKTRAMVEMAFGKWKRRFASLSIPARRSLRHVPVDIRACAVLHNIAITKREPTFFGPDQDFEILTEDTAAAGAAGKARRDYIVRHVFGHRR